jgi:hypothetical protein
MLQNYGQACLDSFNCQNQLLSVDSASTVEVFSLSTVASTFMLSVNEQGIVNQGNNRNGFQSTMTMWTKN